MSEEIAAVESLSCGCCAGTTSEGAVQVQNPPTLNAIAYRVGTHPQFKRSLLAALSSSQHPALRGLRTRRDDDFAIALCDALAMMADTLTFYQERIANEAYLRTAIERRSLLELATLIGYRLAPGVAASAYLAFKLEEAPGAEDQGPRVVTVPVGTRVQSVPVSGGSPHTFETIVKIDARREWNALRPRLTKEYLPKPGGTDMFLAGNRLNLNAGDLIVLVGDERDKAPRSERWQARVVKTANVEGPLTHVTWLDPLGANTPAAQPIRAYMFRDRAAIFGHSAPDWSAQPDTYKANYLGLSRPDQLTVDDRREWPHFTIFAPDVALEPSHFGRLLTPTAEEVATALEEAIKATIAAQAGDVAASVVQVAGAGGAAAQQAIQGVVDSIGKTIAVAEAVPAAAEEVWTTFWAQLEPILRAIGNIGGAVGGIGGAISGLGGTIGGVGTAIGGFGSTVGGTVTEGFKNATTAIVKEIKKLL